MFVNINILYSDYITENIQYHATRYAYKWREHLLRREANSPELLFLELSRKLQRQVEGD